MKSGVFAFIAFLNSYLYETCFMCAIFLNVLFGF